MNFRKDLLKAIAIKEVLETLEEIEEGKVEIDDAVKILAVSFRILLERMLYKKKYKGNKDLYS